MTQPKLSERDHNALLAENEGHGATLFFDLYVKEVYGLELHMELPRNLTASVERDTPSFGLFVPGKCEAIEGIESKLHGNPVHYEKVWDHEGHLRRVGREGGELLSSSASHYHVSNLNHGVVYTGGARKAFGEQSIMHLHDDIRDYDAAIEYLSREALIHSGENVPTDPTFALPPVELASRMLHAYVMGFRKAAESVHRHDVAERTNRLLDVLGKLY